MTKYDILIIGGGHGGAQAAIALRQAKFDGTIAIVSNENHLPYERPPLSKEYFSGDKAFDRIMIRPPAFWDERNIIMILGTHICEIDPVAKTVKTQKDDMFEYGQMIWAGGATPRMLQIPGANLPGVHVVRTKSDVDGILDALETVSRVAIIGGGYVGLEAAAVLRKLDKQVTLLEAQDRVLARVAGEPLSRFYENEHRAHGVDVRLNCDIVEITGDDRVTGVTLADGGMIDVQMIIVGIGVISSVGALIGAGASGGNGVDVDEYCRTSLPDIFAIGDCAAHANEFAGGVVMRVESVQNANDMAGCVVKTIMGEPTKYHAIPWFWSNQYDLKLQTVGLLMDHDETIIRGDPAVRSFSVIYLKSGRVIALDCVNKIKDYVQGRALITSGAIIDREILANDDIAIKEMLST